MKHRLSVALATLLLAATAVSLPAQASTMPKAETDQSSFVLGIGPSLSFDARLAQNVTLGASVGLPFLIEGFDRVSSRYDVRVVYNFFQQGNFFLSGIFGIWGNVNFSNTTLSRWAGLELGLGLAYKFTPQLTGRLNIVPGYNFFGSRAFFNDFYAPAGGVELAYKFSPTFEGTIGYNGQGDLIGLRFRI